MDDRPERLLEISPEEVLALVELIYEAVSQEDRWGAFLRAASDAFGGGATSITLQHPGSDVDPVVATDSPDTAGVSEYAEYFYSVDPFREQTLLLPEGQVGFGNLLVPPGDLERSEIFNDWCRPHGLDTGSMAGMIARHAGVPSVLSVYRRRGGRQLGDADMALSRVLLPHLKRALQLQIRLGESARSAESLLAAMDRLAFGVVLVNAELRALAMNREASRLVEERDGLQLHRGALRGARSRVTRRLHQLVGQAVDPGTDRVPGAGGALLVERAPPRRPLELLVAPLGVPALGRVLGSRVAAVFVTDPDTLPQASALVLVERYGLTASEAEVTSRVSQGMRVDAVATELGISVNTVRARLQEAFAKTGTHRQAELVQLLTRSPVRLRRDE